MEGGTLTRSLWLVPVFLALHNAEEAAALWLRGLPLAVPRVMGPINRPQFLLALAAVTVLPFLFLTMHAARRWKRAGLHLLLLTQAVVFLNVFPHALGAVIAKGYTMGLFSALLVNLPFSILLARAGMREGSLNGKSIVLRLGLAALIHGPGLMGLLWLAGRAVHPHAG